MDSSVYFASAPSYEKEIIGPAVEGLFAALPAAACLGPGKKVLLKPNLLAKQPPEKAVTTHPAVVWAVIQAVKARGVAAGDILLADSPGGAHTSSVLRGIYKTSGLAAVCEQEGVAMYFGSEGSKVPLAPGSAHRFELMDPVQQADVIINLPKLKTHMMTGLSAATKNLFGCILGLRKAEWHMRRPKKAAFGEMLLDLLLTVKPSFAVLDGVVAHEGDGPSGGSPRPVGIVAAAEDHLSMDLALCSMVGIEPQSVPYLAAAMARGLCGDRFSPELAKGQADICRPIKGFRLPSSWNSINFADDAPSGLRWAVPAVQRLVAPRPVINRAACIGCGKCAEICPQNTIPIKNGKATIRRKGCIRCFCCHEVCPVQAIDTKHFILFKAL